MFKRLTFAALLCISGMQAAVNYTLEAFKNQTAAYKQLPTTENLGLLLNAYNQIKPDYRKVADQHLTNKLQTNAAALFAEYENQLKTATANQNNDVAPENNNTDIVDAQIDSLKTQIDKYDVEFTAMQSRYENTIVQKDAHLKELDAKVKDLEDIIAALTQNTGNANNNNDQIDLIARLQTQLENARKDLDKATIKADQDFATYQQATQVINNLSGENAQLKNQLNNNNNAVATLTQKIQDAQAKADDIQQALSAQNQVFEQDKAQLQNEVTTLKTTNADLEKQNEQLSQQFKDLSSNPNESEMKKKFMLLANKKDEEISNLKKQLGEVDKKHQSELADLIKQWQKQKNDDAAQLAEKNKALAELSETAKKDKDTFVAEIEKFKAEQAQIAQIAKENAELKSQFEKQQKTDASTATSVKALRDNNQSLAIELNNAKQNKQTLTQQMNQLKTNSAQSQKELKQQKEETQKIAAQMEDLKKQLTEQITSNNNFAKEVATLKSEVENANDQKADVERQAETQTNHIKDLVTKNDLLSKEFETLKKQLSDQDAQAKQIKDLMAKNAQLNKDMNALKEIYNMRETAVLNSTREFQGEFNTLNDKNKSLNAKIATLEEQLDKAIKLSEDTSQINNSTTKNLNALNKENETLKARIKELEKENATSAPKKEEDKYEPWF